MFQCETPMRTAIPAGLLDDHFDVGFAKPVCYQKQYAQYSRVFISLNTSRLACSNLHARAL